MGQVITEICENGNDIKIVAGVDINPDRIENYYKVYNDIQLVNEKADLVLDFSRAESLPNIARYCVERNLGLVVASTGFTTADYELLKETSKKIPLFQSANMSLGVNLVAEISKIAAKTLSKDFDIEIIERHHNEKVDAPSGTALMLANEINQATPEPMTFVYNRHEEGKRKADEIGIYAIRGGTIPGEHTVIFAGKDEVIEIKHSALSRRIFAEGAIKAVKFLANKDANYYNMNDLIKSLT